MAMLEPKVAILDETDSGLDIDALRIVANGVNKLKNENNAVLVITHYQRLISQTREEIEILMSYLPKLFLKANTNSYKVLQWHHPK